MLDRKPRWEEGKLLEEVAHIVTYPDSIENDNIVALNVFLVQIPFAPKIPLLSAWVNCKSLSPLILLSFWALGQPPPRPETPTVS